MFKNGSINLSYKRPQLPETSDKSVCVCVGGWGVRGLIIPVHSGTRQVQQGKQTYVLRLPGKSII